jgi:hypothetical protein
MAARRSPRSAAKRHTDRQNDEWEIYALAAGPLPARIRIDGSALRVFRIGPIAVIAGPPRAESVSTSGAASMEHALREHHAIVVALAERVDPLLPARFGSRMTAARLGAAIRPSIDVLVSALDHVRGRRQMTVRLIGPAADEPPAASTTGTAYLAQRRAAAHAIPSEAAPLWAAVDGLVIDQRVQPGRGGIRATVFHLVARSDVAAYRSAIERAAPAIAPWSATTSGPWPPFAFAPELLG